MYHAKRNIDYYIFLIICLSLIIGLFGCKKATEEIESPKQEVIYHVVQRSFFDSDGDGHGDLKGLHSKLDYLDSLGVTSILMLPLYESIYYHNYFPINFEQIDSTLGTDLDLSTLIDAAHSRGMKVYMDMEVQYITEDHSWYKAAFGNPESPFSNYILWDDTLNLQPSSIVYDLTEFEGYDGRSTRLTTLNLYSPELLEYMKGFFKSCMDPRGDGSFKGGVDGFRIDHMMDDLDNKGRLTNLFEVFWKPLFMELRAMKPDLIVMAEQADWMSTGHEYLRDADVDWVFSFGLCFAIRSFEKSQIEGAALVTFSGLEPGKNQIVFIANHDIERFASAVGNHPGKLKMGALLNLLIGGVPSIYYGQEIGMLGSGGWNKYGLTDGNEIPVREAFEWHADTSGPGMALWYKDSGPWWEDSKLKPYDGISLEEHLQDTHSLWYHYQSIIKLRNDFQVLSKGVYLPLPNDFKNIFSFSRIAGKESAIIIVNLADEPTIWHATAMDLTESLPTVISNDLHLKTVYGTQVHYQNDKFHMELPPFGYSVMIVSSASE